MRVLVLNYEYPPLGGGAARATAELFALFGNTPGLELELVTSSPGGCSLEDPFPNIRIHRLDIGKGANPHYQSIRELLAYTRLARRYARRLHRARPFDLVHAFFGIPCGHIARSLHLPYIVSLRGSDVPGYSERFRLLDRLLFRRLSRGIWRDAASVVPNSQGLKALAKQTAPGQPMLVIPNGVDTDFFTPVQEKKASKKTHIVSTGRLIERKGYALLLDALAGLPGVRLTLAGDGPLREALSGQARARGVDCSFPGALDRESLRELLRGGDLFILPSANEGMSNSLLEALACGLPAITTDTGGSAELVRDNGAVIPVGDGQALRRELAARLADPARLAAEGARSRAIALTMGWRSVAEQYHTLYREVLQKAEKHQ